MKIQILEEAEQDLVNGFWFYEKQENGLGDYFLDSIFADIDSLQLYAGIHAQFSGYHRLLSKRFPYAIYYKTQDQIAQVWAVLDCRQSPEAIQDRLEQTHLS